MERDCIFCNLAGLNDRLVYKDETVVSFPTNIPITPGHILICPVRHISRIDDISKEELLSIHELIKKTKQSIKKSLGAEGFNIAWNEGETAGQSINHLHIHIVPRKEGDSGVYGYEPRSFLYRPGSRDVSPDEELISIAKILKENL